MEFLVLDPGGEIEVDFVRESDRLGRRSLRLGRRSVLHF